MSRIRKTLGSLTDLLDASGRPVYAVDAKRRIVYCNPALAAWLEMEPERIARRLVEYHSEPTASGADKLDADAPLADLCPPPRALAGEPCAGTISCVARGGRLVHRRAEFVPLDVANAGTGVLVLLADRDLSPQELAAELSGEASADELHRTIRRFRRGEANRYAIESLLGESSAMRKVRAQVAAAAASGANTLVCGRPGTGRGHIARAIHYHAVGDATVKLVPLACELANDDLLRRAIDAVTHPDGDPRHPPTLLLENLDRLDTAHQSQLAAALGQNQLPARIIATSSRHRAPGSRFDRVPGRCAVADTDTTVDQTTADGTRSVPTTMDPALLDAVSTITIHTPRLVERLDDLPILAQYFLEFCNRGSDKQVGSLRTDTLDLLALYTWPGELDELRETIAAAHRACTSHGIVPTHLPAIIHHAARAASHVRRQPERIVLDELLANIEREAITRALAQAGGNKTGAAELLGMTRPRLYRRLVQLGLAGPEFIEHEPTDETP